MAAAVGIVIEAEINGAGAVTQLAKLVRGEMRAERTGGMAEPGLPQHGEIEDTFDKNHTGELADRFPGDQIAFCAGDKSMGEGGADAAAVQVDDAAVLAAREDDALIEGVVALRIDEAGAPQQIEGVGSSTLSSRFIQCLRRAVAQPSWFPIMCCSRAAQVKRFAGPCSSGATTPTIRSPLLCCGEKCGDSAHGETHFRGLAHRGAVRFREHRMM